MFRKRPQFVAGALAAGLGFAALPALAVEYLVRPLADLRLDYDDNLRLGAIQQIEAYSYRLRAGTNVRATAETWRVNGDFRLETVRFDENAYSTDNQFGSVTFAHFTPRRQLQLNVTLDRDSLLGNEFDTTGFIGFEASRVERVAVSPASVWQLSERDSLTVSGSYTSVHFRNRLFNDYHNYALDVTWARSLSPRLVAELSAFGSEFQDIELGQRCDNIVFQPFTELNGLTSRTLGLQVALRQALTERIEWSVSLGGRDVTSDALVRQCNPINLIFGFPPLIEEEQSEDSSGLIARTSGRYVGQRFEADGSFERAIQPAGLGFLLENDEYAASLNMKVDELSDLSLRLTWTESNAITGGSDFARESQVALASYSRQLSERWRIGGGVRYRTQTASFLRGRANATAVFLELAYRPQPVQVSR